ARARDLERVLPGAADAAQTLRPADLAAPALDGVVVTKHDRRQYRRRPRAAPGSTDVCLSRRVFEPATSDLKRRVLETPSGCARSAGVAGQAVADAALALDQIVGVYAGELAPHAMNQLADVLAVGLHRAKRQRVGDLVPRDVGELGIADRAPALDEQLQ